MLPSLPRTKHIPNTLSAEVNKCYRELGLAPTEVKHKKTRGTGTKLSSSKQAIKGFARWKKGDKRIQMKIINFN